MLPAETRRDLAFGGGSLYHWRMISVVIATQNSEAALAETLRALVPASAAGVVKEVVVADAGSADGTRDVADAAGCVLVAEDGGRGAQLAAGAAAASRGTWLLFLEPGAVPEPGWEARITHFIERAERAGRGERVAGAFRYAREISGRADALKARCLALAGDLLGLRGRDSALLVSRDLYRKLGGHRPGSARPEAGLWRRLGRGAVRKLDVRAYLDEAR